VAVRAIRTRVRTRRIAGIRILIGALLRRTYVIVLVDTPQLNAF
jgi:hypothetical protein